MIVNEEWMNAIEKLPMRLQRIVLRPSNNDDVVISKRRLYVTFNSDLAYKVIKEDCLNIISAIDLSFSEPFDSILIDTQSVGQEFKKIFHPRYFARFIKTPSEISRNYFCNQSELLNYYIWFQDNMPLINKNYQVNNEETDAISEYINVLESSKGKSSNEDE